MGDGAGAAHADAMPAVYGKARAARPVPARRTHGAFPRKHAEVGGLLRCGIYNPVMASVPFAQPVDACVYRPRRVSESRFLTVRRLRYHLRVWQPDPSRPVDGDLWLLHGWMDVSASFQFLVDAMSGNWRIHAPDWRGFGLSDRPEADCYWFPDYMADLDELLRQVSGDEPVDLVAHSMGGNVAMLYAGARPTRVRRLVNLEGVGLRDTPADEAPRRYEAWLDELRTGARLRDYADLGEVAARMMRSNPRLSPDRAAFLAGHWSRVTAAGRRELLGDPAHKIVNAMLYRAEEVQACWRRIAAPVLLVLAGESQAHRAFLREPAFQQRLQAVRGLRQVVLEEAGHMLHHNQPQALARLLEAFLGEPVAGPSA